MQSESENSGEIEDGYCVLTITCDEEMETYHLSMNYELWDKLLILVCTNMGQVLNAWTSAKLCEQIGSQHHLTRRRIALSRREWETLQELFCTCHDQCEGDRDFIKIIWSIVDKSIHDGEFMRNELKGMLDSGDEVLANLAIQVLRLPPWERGSGLEESK